jgi:hypothetical protein
MTLTMPAEVDRQWAVGRSLGLYGKRDVPAFHESPTALWASSGEEKAKE